MWIDKLVGDLGEKKRWREARARIGALPEPYRESAQAVESYLLHVGAIDDDKWTTAFEDLADLFERAALDATPIRDLIGEDPLEFTEAFARNYGSGWRTRAQRKLTDAVARADRGGER